MSKGIGDWFDKTDKRIEVLEKQVFGYVTEPTTPATILVIVQLSVCNSEVQLRAKEKWQTAPALGLFNGSRAECLAYAKGRADVTKEEIVTY